jgi:hypothetical protein
MALIKKASTQITPYQIQIPAELLQRIEAVTQKADTQGMVFDLQTTLVRTIRAELTRAETVLNGGGRKRAKAVSADSAQA